GLASMGYTRRGCHIVGGDIIFGGEDIRTISPDERRALRGPKIAYIAQSAAAVALFRELDLPSPETIGGRYPHQVSGGQLQRVMAAMAMVAKPDILIF